MWRGVGLAGGTCKCPPPRPLPPMAISATVHCIGTGRRKNRVRLSPDSHLFSPGTLLQSHSGHGFPLGITTHCPHRFRAGEELRMGGRGGGLRVALLGETGEGVSPMSANFSHENSSL